MAILVGLTSHMPRCRYITHIVVIIISRHHAVVAIIFTLRVTVTAFIYFTSISFVVSAYAPFVYILLLPYHIYVHCAVCCLPYGFSALLLPSLRHHANYIWFYERPRSLSAAATYATLAIRYYMLEGYYATLPPRHGYRCHCCLP